MFDEPYELLLGPSDCCEAVVVDYDQKKHARRPHALDDLIDETWARALDAKPNLFDGAKFRLASASSSGGTATLRIGLTGYREYVGTNRAPHWERLAGDGGAHLSNALGCETALETADGMLALFRRSAAVATHGGLYNGPSGHAEPGRVKGFEGFRDAPPDAAAVSRELLEDAILMETVEEVGVPLASLSKPKLIGVMRDSRLKPDLLFLVRTTLVSEAVRARHATAVEAWESDDLRFVPVDAPDGAFPALTPVTRAALACLRELRAREKARARTTAEIERDL
jgi:8-oxo-dGTP pyrophosphatase MutT (NUDIX family)